MGSRHTLTDMGGFALAMKEQRVKRATAYLDTDLTVKVTFVGNFDRREKQAEFRLTVGRPNYAERKFIKKCVKAKEPFPVKKVQLKYAKKKLPKVARKKYR